MILDGLVSSYPASARGYSVANSYLLTQPDAAMLIDTGFGKDEPVIRAQINHLSFFLCGGRRYIRPIFPPSAR